ncbi:MAG: DUF642 domain-containing protein [Acidimicrobiales bacterium]
MKCGRVRARWRPALVATFAMLAAGLAGLANPASAAPFEGTFENPPLTNTQLGYDTYSTTNPNFGPWTVTAGDIEHGTKPAGTTCHNQQCVDLNGSYQGAIAQTFDTPEGANCQVSFRMSRHIQLASLSATLTATINNVTQGTFTHNLPGMTASDARWELKSFSFVAGAGPTTQLGFRSSMPGARGPQIDTVSVNCRETGVLKVCKVAGPQVPVGQGFTFKVNNTASVAVPAGPAPGGYCTKAGRYPLGSNVTITEAAVTGTTVTSISVSPPNRLVGTPNLGTRTVTATMGSGVTEVTFTNARGETGWIEVCKEYKDPAMLKPAPMFHFDVPGVPGGVDVPAGACSPALQVPAGSITVTETLGSGSALTGCSTIPSTALLGCATNTGKADVKVAAGGPSTQTILTFVNVPRET